MRRTKGEEDLGFRVSGYVYISIYIYIYIYIYATPSNPLHRNYGHVPCSYISVNCTHAREAPSPFNHVSQGGRNHWLCKARQSSTRRPSSSNSAAVSGGGCGCRGGGGGGGGCAALRCFAALLQSRDAASRQISIGAGQASGYLR